MKTIKSLKMLTTTLVVLSLFLSSCKKGDTGPAGPAGASGKDGKDGVANIQTNTVTTNNSSWVFDSSDNSYMATLTYTAISQAVLDKGTVQVFVNDGGSTWIALPLSYGVVQYNYGFELSKVLILVNLSNGSIPSSPGGQTFKVVVIPPASKSPTADNADNEVKEAIFTIK